MGHIFVSYSHKDAELAGRIVARLEAEGFDIWIDSRSIAPGADWEDNIEAAITNCDALLLLQTPESKASPRVKKEWLYAEHLGRPIFPVLCEGDLWFSFVDVQYTDLRHTFDEPMLELTRTLPPPVPVGSITARNVTELIHLGTRFKHKQHINQVAFSSSGKYLGAVGGHGVVEVANLFAQGEAASVLLTQYGLEAKSISFRPDENVVAVATRNESRQSSLKIYDLNARRQIYAAREAEHGTQVRFTPDGQYLIFVEGGITPRIFVYDAMSFELLHIISPETKGSIRSLAVSPDSLLFATCGRVPPGVTLWQLPDGAKSEFLEFDDSVTSIVDIAFTADRRYFAAATFEGVIWLWDSQTGNKLPDPIVTGKPIQTIASNQRGDVLAVANDSFRTLEPQTVLGTETGIREDVEIQLWDIQKRQLLYTLTDHDLRVNSLAFSLDGMQLASAGGDKQVYVWGIPQ